VQLSVRTTKLEWKRRAGANEEEREVLDYLDEHEDELGLELPTAMMDCVGDPRTHEPEGHHAPPVPLRRAQYATIAPVHKDQA
jgi:hypothetical protein